MRNAKLLSVALLVTTATVGACVKRVEPSPVNMVGASLVLEQFLRASNAREWATMGTLFGTKDGPVSKIDDKTNVETRMAIFANVLRHDDYKIEGEQVVPGRSSEATQLNVTLTKGKEKVMVPFVMVRTKDGQWLLESFNMEKITRPRL